MCCACGKSCRSRYDTRRRRARDLGCGGREVYLDFEIRRLKCRTCGVRNEKLDFLSTNTKYTLRFAMQIGGLRRAMTIQDVAREMRLDWHAVKDLDKMYMREQLARAGHPAPRVIGIDEISTRKKHVYRIVVSDLEQKRAIWFGGEGRSEADKDQFYAFLGPENAQKFRLAGMDARLPFRKSTQARAKCFGLVRQVPHPTPSRRGSR